MSQSMLLVQGIGLIAVFLSLTIFQTNKRNTMLKLGMTAALLYSVHFVLLGAVTGAAMNLVGALRSYVYYRVKPDKHHEWILFGFMMIAVIGALITWQGWISLLPLFGSLAGGFATWHKKPKYIRRWALIPPPLWLTYNAISGSYPGMLIEAFMLVSNIVGEYRFDFRHKKHHARLRWARPL